MSGWQAREQYWDERFQQAALDPSQWLPALKAMADATGSAHGQLLGVGDARAIPFNWVTDVDPSARDAFVRIGGGSPGVSFRIAADAGSPPSAIIHEVDYDRVRPALLGDAYLDYCADHDVPNGCQTALVRDGAALIGLAVLRSRADGRTSAAERREFARAAKAAGNAVRLQRAIERQGAALIAGTIEAMALDCYLLDGFGRVCGLSSGGERHLEPGGALRTLDRRLGAHDAADTRAIERATATVLGGGGHARIALRTGERSSAVLDLYRLPRREWTLGVAPRAIAIMRDPRARMAANASLLATSYGLSPAETDIAVMLCQGRSRAWIAAHRAVTMETLRAQIKSIYLKCGCQRESELVLLLSAMLS